MGSGKLRPERKRAKSGGGAGHVTCMEANAVVDSVQLAWHTSALSLGLAVTFHATTTGGLEVEAAGVVNDSLADQPDRGCGLPEHDTSSAAKAIKTYRQ